MVWMRRDWYKTFFMSFPCPNQNSKAFHPYFQRKSRLKAVSGASLLRLAVRMILATSFDHLDKRFCYEEVQFKMFCPSVKASCHLSENVNENP